MGFSIGNLAKGVVGAVEIAEHVYFANYPIKSSEYGSKNSQWKIYKACEEPKDIDESQIKEEVGE